MQLEAGEPVLALDYALGGPESAAYLAGPVGEVLTCPHPVGRIIGEMPLVVFVGDDGALACGGGGWGGPHGRVGRGGGRFRAAAVPPRRESPAGAMGHRPGL